MADPDFYDRFVSYLVVPAAALFLLGIENLRHQKSAQKGNVFSMLGMLFVVVAVFMSDSLKEYGYLLAGLSILIGLVAGALFAWKVTMNSMPQMVGLLNSFGGLAAALSSVGLYLSNPFAGMSGWILHEILVAIVMGVIVGSITFFGSIIACLKLQGTIGSKPVLLPFRHFWNAVMALAIVALAILFLLATDDLNPTRTGTLDSDLGIYFLLACCIVSSIFGIHWVIAIGGADMPVVISALNSFSGWATTFTGFADLNAILIITGAIVGGSGAILSYVMCRAMNRPFIQVMMGGFGVKEGAVTSATGKAEDVKKITIEETAELLLQSEKIMFTPGYGMAVAQAQYAVAELCELLRAKGIDVTFGVHPVAGRLPGHMNVLLAEANVPYNVVLGMDEVNPTMPETDVVIVIGANDTVNPAAEEDPNSQIYGMPVIQVWKAKKVVVVKRSLGAGYAGVDNTLFFKSNCSMLLSDAKKAGEGILQILQKKLEDRKNTPTDKRQAMERQKREEEEKKKTEELQNIETYMTVGVPAEVHPGEKRVAITPDVANKLRRAGFAVWVETGAGDAANCPDIAYEKAGCKIVASAPELWKGVDIVMKVRGPQTHPVENVHELEFLPKRGENEEVNTDKKDSKKKKKKVQRKQTIVVSFVWPGQNPDLLAMAQERDVTLMAMDLVPRISRAQKLDALSSTSNIAGYRAVIECANMFGRFFTGQTTAAGSLKPAVVLVMGAGVAGLSAIGAARGLGAIVRAFDTRAVVKDQVKSLRAEFLEVDYKEEGEGSGGYAKEMSEGYKRAQSLLISEQSQEADIIITTALIPGRPAPLLITKEMVESMRPGSVILDMAAEMGGNCELTVKNTVHVTKNGVSIIGYTDLPSRMASVSSQLYANNLAAFLEECGNGKDFNLSKEDQTVIRPMTVVKNGEKLWPPAPVAAPAAQKAQDGDIFEEISVWQGWKNRIKNFVPEWFQNYINAATVIIVATAFGVILDEVFHTLALIFVLSCVVGYLLIWNVSPALHTPLMSLTNAISGIVILSGLALIGDGSGDSHQILGIIAVLVASVNIVGGFLVTQRMLSMFIRK